MLVAFSSLSLISMMGTWICFVLQLNEHPIGLLAIFGLFTAFEFALGGYMSSVAVLKAAWIPDEMRATVYNILRVPLNFVVVVINVVSLSSNFTFLVCTLLTSLSLLFSFATCRFDARKAKVDRQPESLL